MIQEQTVVEVGGRDSAAYRNGWEDGRFGAPETFTANPSLGAWTEYLDRLAYYRGHREGRRVRGMLGVHADRA